MGLPTAVFLELIIRSRHIKGFKLATGVYMMEGHSIPDGLEPLFIKLTEAKTELKKILSRFSAKQGEEEVLNGLRRDALTENMVIPSIPQVV